MGRLCGRWSHEPDAPSGRVCYERECSASSVLMDGDAVGFWQWKGCNGTVVIAEIVLQASGTEHV